MDISNFIMQNTGWLIFFCVLILMALIGYSVEKKKGKGSNKNNVEHENRFVNLPPQETMNGNQVMPTSAPNNMNVVSEVYNMNMVSSAQTTSVEANAAIPEVITATGENLAVPIDGPASFNTTNENASMNGQNPSVDIAVNDISTMLEENKNGQSNGEDVWKF